MRRSEIPQAFARAMQQHQSGQLAGAEPLYREILEAQKSHAEALHFLSLLLHQTNRSDEALPLMRKSIELMPTNAGFRSNAAAMYQTIGMHQQAADEARVAISIAPELADAHYNLGLALRDLKQLEEAVASLKRSIQLRPDRVVGYENLALALTRLGRADEAFDTFERAVQLFPTEAGAWTNFANAQLTAGLLDEAIASIERAESLNPRLDKAGSNRLIALNYHPSIEPQALFDAHMAWAKRHAEPLKPAHAQPVIDRDPNRPLRIGYVSPDFRQHSVATFLAPLLAAHDHEQFHVTCYSHTTHIDAMTARFQGYADQWRDIARVPDDAVVERIRADEIDVLIDLAGHTGDRRLLIFARQPAPVQISYLGWQNTTAMSAIGWRITDSHVDPPELTDRFYTERLIRLPETFAVYEPHPLAGDVVAPLPASRNGFITFGSFARLEKISPRMLAIWARALLGVPRSRLRMFSDGLHSSRGRDRIIAILSDSGVATDRIELVGSLPVKEYFAAHAHVDLIFDTFPFNGHTTTCHGLWMGVPTITLAGDRFASRMGLSVMTNLALPQLVAKSDDDFVERGVKLASDVDALALLRTTMRDRMRGSALMDAQRFARQFETALRFAWQEFCSIKDSA